MGRAFVMDRANSPLLLVEADAELRHALTQLLEYEGYDVAAAAHGGEALEYLRGHAPPGLMLLDLEVPLLDGWALLKELVGAPELAELPVVVFTGQRGIGAAAASAHVRAALPKPLFLDTLLSTVQQWYQPKLRNGG